MDYGNLVIAGTQLVRGWLGGRQGLVRRWNNG
jgi:hypothetical protein